MYRSKAIPSQTALTRELLINNNSSLELFDVEHFRMFDETFLTTKIS